MKKTLLFLIALLLFIGTALIATEIKPTSEIPCEILYPPFLHSRDAITYENVKKEVISKFKYRIIFLEEHPYQRCYKNQKRLYKALENMKTELEAEGQAFTLPEINNETAFSEDSIIGQYAKMAIVKPADECEFAIYKDKVDEIGIVYCKTHGIERDLYNNFAKRNMARFHRARPTFNAFDVAEFLVFLPAPLLFLISAYVMKKIIKA